MPSNMFRAKKGASYKYPDDEQTDDLNGFPRFVPEHSEKFPLTGPCNAYDRDEEVS